MTIEDKTRENAGLKASLALACILFAGSTVVAMLSIAEHSMAEKELAAKTAQFDQYREAAEEIEKAETAKSEVPETVSETVPEPYPDDSPSSSDRLGLIKAELAASDAKVIRLGFDLERERVTSEVLTAEVSVLKMTVGDYREHQTNWHRFCELENPFPGSERARESFLRDIIRLAE